MRRRSLRPEHVSALLVRERGGRIVHWEAHAVGARPLWLFRAHLDARRLWLELRYRPPRYEIREGGYQDMSSFRSSESALFSEDGAGASMLFGPWDPSD